MSIDPGKPGKPKKCLGFFFLPWKTGKMPGISWKSEKNLEFDYCVKIIIFWSDCQNLIYLWYHRLDFSMKFNILKLIVLLSNFLSIDFSFSSTFHFAWVCIYPHSSMVIIIPDYSYAKGFNAPWVAVLFYTLPHILVNLINTI